MAVLVAVLLALAVLLVLLVLFAAGGRWLLAATLAASFCLTHELRQLIPYHCNVEDICPELPAMPPPVGILQVRASFPSS
jgi:hypothetical protein